MSDTRITDQGERNAESSSAQGGAKLASEALGLLRNAELPAVRLQIGEDVQLGNLTIVDDEVLNPLIDEVSDVLPRGARGARRPQFAQPPARPFNGQQFGRGDQPQPLSRLHNLNPVEEFIKSGDSLGNNLVKVIRPDGTEDFQGLSPQAQSDAMNDLANKLARVANDSGSLMSIVIIDQLNRELEKQMSPYRVDYVNEKPSSRPQVLTLLERGRRVMSVNVPSK